MAMKEEKHFGEALLSSSPHNTINLKLKDGSVGTGKLADGSVTLDKLGDDVITEIHDGIKIDDEMSHESKNPVQNKVISGALDGKVDDNAYLTYYDINKIIYDVFGF